MAFALVEHPALCTAETLIITPKQLCSCLFSLKSSAKSAPHGRMFDGRVLSCALTGVSAAGSCEHVTARIWICVSAHTKILIAGTQPL